MEDSPVCLSAESVYEDCMEGIIAVDLSSDSFDAEDGNAFADECMGFLQNHVTSSSVVDIQRIISTMFKDLRRQCRAIHADCAMDESQKFQKLRELQYRLQSPKANEAAPPVQPKKKNVTECVIVRTAYESCRQKSKQASAKTKDDIQKKNVLP